LHNDGDDEIYGGLRYDRANQPRSLERVLVTTDVPNDNAERGDVYSGVPFPMKNNLLHPLSDYVPKVVPNETVAILGRKPGAETT
jgi:hypothetical protein